MKVDIEKIPGNKVKLQIELTPDEFREYYEEGLQDILAKAEVKGFRRGKVPRDMYLRRFGEGQVLQRAFDQALKDTYVKAIKEENVPVISDPAFDIDFNRYTNDKVFSYKAEVDVYPEVVLGQYYGVEVEKISTEVTAQDIDKYIFDIRKSKSDLEILEEGILENGHIAIFDFEGFVDQLPFEGGKAENYQLEIGSGAFITGFEEQMTGMGLGEEKTVYVKFPDDYSAENLRGKPAEFKVKLHEIKRRILPELDDNFVIDLKIPDVNNVEVYEEYVGELLRTEKKKSAEENFEYNVVKKVCDNATVEPSELLVQKTISHIISQAEDQAKSYKLSLEQFLSYQGLTLEKYKEIIAGPAKFDVLKELVINKIIEVEKIDLSDEDFEEGYRRLAKTYGQSMEDIRVKYPAEQVSYYFLLEKTIDLLKQNAKVIE